MVLQQFLYFLFLSSKITKLKISSLIDCMAFKVVFSRLFHFYHIGQCTYPCFPGIFTSTPLNIVSKPLAAFLHKCCRNNRQLWQRNESCSNDYHQSSERILAKPWDQTCDLLFSSPVRYRLNYEAQLKVGSNNLSSCHQQVYFKFPNKIQYTPYSETMHG